MIASRKEGLRRKQPKSGMICVKKTNKTNKQTNKQNPTNFGTVSRATPGRLLRDGVERVWALPSAAMSC